VSSDSDFTPLAQRLRESGKKVIGFGQRHTPSPFVTACERFIYTENLAPGAASPPEAGSDALRGSGTYGGAGDEGGNKGKRTIPERTLQQLSKVVMDAGDDEGWVNLATVGGTLATLKSDFDVRTYGFRKLAGMP